MFLLEDFSFFLLLPITQFINGDFPVSRDVLAIELVEVEQTFISVVDLIVSEQFTSSCPEDLSVWLKQSNPKPLDEFSRLADQYLAARNQKLSSKEAIKRIAQELVKKHP